MRTENKQMHQHAWASTPTPAVERASADYMGQLARRKMIHWLITQILQETVLGKWSGLSLSLYHGGRRNHWWRWRNSVQPYVEVDLYPFPPNL
jgi:hypothetical protein